MILAPFPYPTSPAVPDPGPVLGALAGVGFASVLFMLVIAALGVWASYWLIRLAVRHGGMDVRRWERAGMPRRMPKKPPAGGYGSSGSFFS